MIEYSKKTIDAFFSLLRAGLWEKGVRLSDYEPVDFSAVYDLAVEQSVVGLVAAGLEHVEDRKVTKPEAVPFMKKVFSYENRNQAMNDFIGSIVRRMTDAEINAVLVKGQGVAQCYSRPQWRAAGDVDFLLDDENYQKAKALLIPLANSVHNEDCDAKHQSMDIGSWVVELHGRLHNRISNKSDRMIDEVQKDTLSNGGVRVWNNKETTVFLPAPDNDVILIFSHILQHFFRGGIGLRQICDWCRLLWTYRDSINRSLLEERIRRMGLMTEWKSFAAYAVDYLGMPLEAMPLYDSRSQKWTRKARRINSFILEVGNFGHNRDSGIYKKYPYFVFKAISFTRHIGDFLQNVAIFPMDSVRALGKMLSDGFIAIAKGK